MNKDNKLKNEIYDACLIVIKEHGINGLNIESLYEKLDVENKILAELGIKEFQNYLSGIFI